MATAIGCLTQLYKGVAVYTRVGKSFNPTGTPNTEPTQSSSTITKNWMCTKAQGNSKQYESDECPYLPPHLWNSSKMKRAPKKDSQQ